MFPIEIVLPQVFVVVLDGRMFGRLDGQLVLLVELLSTAPRLKHRMYVEKDCRLERCPKLKDDSQET